MRPSLPILNGEPAPTSERAAKPPWLKVKAPGGPRYAAMKQREASLDEIAQAMSELAASATTSAPVAPV